ncbi:hypothetical protein PR002_g19146 [Phytophthora rubi]|uniref:Uncharacterized protein n=1 Tax=Phytophthora rubi TaxID=129364 RepID=A0A6A3JZ43_9STRA|nr:hypothetical protein PR002_g19146 [Phytophthora rubi]
MAPGRALRDKTAKPSPVYREMGRDHSSDEDFVVDETAPDLDDSPDDSPDQAPPTKEDANARKAWCSSPFQERKEASLSKLKPTPDTAKTPPTTKPDQPTPEPLAPTLTPTPKPDTPTPKPPAPKTDKPTHPQAQQPKPLAPTLTPSPKPLAPTLTPSPKPDTPTPKPPPTTDKPTPTQAQQQKLPAATLTPTPKPDKPTPKPDTPTLPPALKPDTPKAPPAVTQDTSESKPTTCHGAPDSKQAPMPKPTAPRVQNPKKPTTPTQKPGHTSAKRASCKRKARPSENNIGSRGKESSSGSSAGTRAPKPKGPKRVVSPHKLIGANDSASESGDSDAPTQVTDPFEDLSSTSGDREKVAAAHVDVINHADAVLRKGYQSWQQLMEALKAYGIAKGFHFRIRSSKSVVKCRGSDGPEIPADFIFGFRSFRCIHDVMQASRGDGVRDSHVNFTDCKARFDAFVTRVTTADGGQVWAGVFEESTTCTSGGPVADNVAVLADADTGSQQMASYATAELGEYYSVSDL